MDLLHCDQNFAAEELLRESLAIREKQEPDVWTTFNTMSMLGGALLGAARKAGDGSEKANLLADTEPLLLKGYEGIMARLVVDGQNAELFKVQKQRLAEASDRLIELHTILDKPEEVNKWQAEREKWK